MRKSILLIVVVFIWFLSGCKYSMDVKRANENYTETILSKCDNKYLAHFPSSIEYLPVGFGVRVKDKNIEQAFFLTTKYPENIFDTLYSYFQNNSVQIYDANQENLLIVNRFTTEDNWFESKVVAQKDIFYFNNLDYGTKLPVPNFWDESYTKGNTACNLSPDFKLFVVEAKSGVFFEDSLLSDGEYMPDLWRNGYSRGIAMSKDTRKVIYWFNYW